MKKILLFILKNVFLYNSNMTRIDAYEYFLKDIKKETPHIISQKLYESQSRDILKREIINNDIKYYRVIGNNNRRKTAVKQYVSVSKIKGVKREIFAVLEYLLQEYCNIPN